MWIGGVCLANARIFCEGYIIYLRFADYIQLLPEL
jgi:hypothetical protein